MFHGHFNFCRVADSKEFWNFPFSNAEFDVGLNLYRTLDAALTFSNVFSKIGKSNCRIRKLERPALFNWQEESMRALNRAQSQQRSCSPCGSDFRRPILCC